MIGICARSVRETSLTVGRVCLECSAKLCTGARIERVSSEGAWGEINSRKE